jgi:hypothetical protein
LHLKATDRLCIARAACLAAVLVCAFPAAASAADTFADASRADDTGDCLTPATACKTIGGAISKAGAGDAVHVVPDVYPENVTLSNGISLIGMPGNPPPTISPTTGVALTVTGGPAGTIQGMKFVSNVANQPEVLLGDDAGSTVVTGDQFVDPTPTSDNQAGVRTTSRGNPVIRGNTFTDLMQGVQVQAPASGVPGNPAINQNTFSGTHDVGNAVQVVGPNTFPSAVTGPTSATVVGNLIHDPGANQAVGVFVLDPGSFASESTAPTTGVVMERNRIFGVNNAFQDAGARAPVTLFGDVFAHIGPAPHFGAGILADSVNGLGGDLTVTNIDIVNDNNLGAEIGGATHLTVDSSIFAQPILVDPMAAATCTITFSDGPTTTGGPCDTFQTSAAPFFVDPTTDDYHLTSTGNSDLIDQGDPAAPPAGAIDFDGDPRAIDADAACPLNPVRDIGADEFNPGIPDCAPPPPPPGGGGPPTTPAPTGQRAAALKKCKKKRSAKARRKCRKRAQALPV